jgi:predicted hydrolase (HD superfamily)
VIDRFSLVVAFRNQVSDRALRRRYLAVEAVMQALAGSAALDPGLCALAGLGAGFDAQLCSHNPERRGRVAAELLRTEGAPAEVAVAVEQCFRQADAAALSPLAALLAVADAVVGEIYDRLAEQNLAELDTFDLAHAVERRARRRGEPRARRLLDCAAATRLDLEGAITASVSAMIAIRADLGL